MLFLHLSPITQGIYMSFLNLNQYSLRALSPGPLYRFTTIITRY